MSRFDHFIGAMLILATVAAFANLAIDNIVKHPGWFGAWLLVSNLGCAFLVVRSIWKDRL